MKALFKLKQNVSQIHLPTGITVYTPYCKIHKIQLVNEIGSNIWSCPVDDREIEFVIKEK